MSSDLASATFGGLRAESGSRPSTDIQEYLGPDASIAPWAADSRRPSQATISGDDSFQRGLRNHDEEYPQQRAAWSFYRQGDVEPAFGTSSSGRRIKWTSVSRCAQIGILRSERSVMVSCESYRSSYSVYGKKN